MDASEIKLKQERAGNIRIGDWLPNLGQVNRVLTNGSNVRFYFGCSASREFDIAAIVYREAGRDHPSRKWNGDDAPLAPRHRAAAIRGVTIE